MKVNVPLVLGGAAAVAAGCLVYQATRKSGGPPDPVTETHYGDPSPVAPVLQIQEMTGPVVYTAHRYPRVCGQELTAVIHRGWAIASIPPQSGEYWMERPPSELVL